MAEFITPTSQSRPLYKGTQIVWFILNVLEFLLLFRFILKLLGANPAAGFSSLIYGVTYPFAQPFLTVFNQTRVAGSVIEWTTLLAMLVYYFIALALIRLVFIGKPVSDIEAEEKLVNQDPQNPTV